MSFLSTLPGPGSLRNRRITDAIVNGRLDAVTWIAVGPLFVSARHLTIEGETIPMCGDVAQAAVESLCADLPTVEVVDAIEATPGCVLAYLPSQIHRVVGGEQQTAAFVRCELETRAMFERMKVPPCALVAGYRKDVVQPAEHETVAIYGARMPLGGRLQPLSMRHGLHYADYSHGVRAVRGLPSAWRYPLPW